MRLIDADLLIERIYKNTKIGHYGEFMDGSEVAYTHNEIVKAIEEQPTAFDAEKVEDEMIKATKKGVECGVYPQGFIHCLTAVGIVKGGGINTECDEESECER